MSFGITPSGSGVPATDQGWPRYIQFRYNGVDLGGPDADTVDFVGEILAVRGTSGGDENTVTVTLISL
jgi:hypothetical protein